ncbi:MAG: hypothetical protein JWM11_2911, partial [Planctomycetaceae bacterium]|nr:hypothetical protein [Planctomycetaceae bacterium]
NSVELIEIQAGASLGRVQFDSSILAVHRVNKGFMIVLPFECAFVAESLGTITKIPLFEDSPVLSVASDADHYYFLFDDGRVDVYSLTKASFAKKSSFKVSEGSTNLYWWDSEQSFVVLSSHNNELWLWQRRANSRFQLRKGTYRLEERGLYHFRWIKEHQNGAAFICVGERGFYQIYRIDNAQSAPMLKLEIVTEAESDLTVELDLHNEVLAIGESCNLYLWRGIDFLSMDEESIKIDDDSTIETQRIESFDGIVTLLQLVGHNRVAVGLTGSLFKCMELPPRDRLDDTA